MRYECSRNNYPQDGYVNTKVDPAEQKYQWVAHPLILHRSLAEGDVRKGEINAQDFIRKYRWFNEYGKAYNLKEFRLNLSTTPASDLREYASYEAYITGSNKIFYLHEYLKAAIWRDVEALLLMCVPPTFQIPFRPEPQLKLLHLTKMVNVPEALYDRYNHIR